MRPHRWQPTRLPGPWDSPGKNTGVGCHFLLQCMKVKSASEVAVVSDSSRPHGLQPTRFLHPWDFPGKSTGMGCHCLLRRKRRLVTSFSGKLTGFLPSPYPHSMIYGVFSSAKVEFYSFSGNYFDTHNSFNSRIRSFHKLLHSHFINSLPDKDPL